MLPAAPASSPSAWEPPRSFPWEAGLAQNVCKPQGKGQELSLTAGAGEPCGEPQGWEWRSHSAAKPGVVMQRRGQWTHTGNGVLQQKLGPLAPCCSPLLLLELPWQQAAEQGEMRRVKPLQRCRSKACPGYFGHSPLFMDIFAFSPLLQVAGAALSHAGGFLWQHFAGGVWRDTNPQTEDAFLLFDFLPTQKPGK